MTVWFDHFILVKLCKGTCILVNVLGNPTNSTRMAWAKLAAWCAGDCLEASRHDHKIWKRSVFAARSDIFLRTTNGSHAMNKLELASCGVLTWICWVMLPVPHQARTLDPLWLPRNTPEKLVPNCIKGFGDPDSPRTSLQRSTILAILQLITEYYKSPSLPETNNF